MNLKTATKLVLLGLTYIIFHKSIISLYPSILNTNLISNTFSVLWFTATSTVILFSYCFLKEYASLKTPLKISLQLVIFFTAVILIFRLPFGRFINDYLVRNVLIESTKLLNSASMLLFFIFFNRTLTIN